LAFSPNGKQFASASVDQTCRIWDASNGRAIREIKVSEGDVNTLAYSPSGKILLTGSDNGKTIFWETSTGKKLHVIKGNTFVMRVAFSPDGNHFSIAFHDGVVQYWHTKSKRLLKTFYLSGIPICLAFSPNGKQLLVGTKNAYRRNEGDIALLDIDTKRVVRSFGHHKTADRRSQTYYLYAVAFSPDGSKVIASTANRQGNPMNDFVMWDAHTGKKLMVFQENVQARLAFNALAFSADGELIVAGNWDGTIHIIWAKKGALLQTIRGNYHDPNSITSGINSIDIAASGDKLVAGSWDNHVYYWQNNGKSSSFSILKGHIFDVFEVRFSPDGKQILSGGFDNKIRLWDATNGKQIRVGAHQNNVNAIAFSPDGKQVLSGSSDHTVKRWNTTNFDKPLETIECSKEYQVTAAEFSPSGKRFLYAVQGNVYSRGIDGNEKRFFPHKLFTQFSINSATYAPNGKEVASGGSHYIKIWDAETEKLKQTIPARHAKKLKYAKKGGWFAAIAGRDREVKLWKVGADSLTFLRSFTAPHTYFTSVVFSPDGTRLLAANDDNNIYIWHTATQKLLGILYTRLGYGAWAVVTPEGKYDGNQAGIAYLNYVATNGKATPVPAKGPHHTMGLLAKILKDD
jgi:WD40 repeat protein